VEVGRDARAGVPLLQDELVSRRHVRLTPEGDGVQVEDLESSNGTFVDGDQIFGPAHLSVDGQLLVGVTLLQLRNTQAAANGTALRPIPQSLTGLRPLPSAPPQPSSDQSTPSLAVPEAEPDYVPRSALEEGVGASALFSLLDVHTKSKARGAPIGLFVLVAFAVILYLALR
jgi:ABC transport system ATP-binding/permease protein